MASKLKILVVDDEVDVVEFLRYNLVKQGFDVISANSGIEALEVAKGTVPDLIIMDVRMPGLNGIETCRQMRMMDLLKEVPVLFLTADSDEYTTMSAFDAGADHFITKPIRPGIIAGMIKELLEDKF